jgi:ubiquinone/menaquinone biosynthesis C-methylase UbiE
MFSLSAHLYDRLYSFKDYKTESETLVELIRSKKPDAKTILDIGCGTAEHHLYLKNEFYLDGLDINEGFIPIARSKNQDGAYYVGDMTAFSLDKKYDVILCLFSSIGYVKTIDKLESTLHCFSDHLAQGGLVILEPWLTPESWTAGKLFMLTYDADDVKICRMNCGRTEGNASVLQFSYLVGYPGQDVQYFEERHDLALFRIEEMKNAFTASGFDVVHDEAGLTGRGMYYGTKNNGAFTTPSTIGAKG